MELSESAVLARSLLALLLDLTLKGILILAVAGALAARSHAPAYREGYAKAEMPVISRPRMRVWMSWVPS